MAGNYYGLSVAALKATTIDQIDLVEGQALGIVPVTPVSPTTPTLDTIPILPGEVAGMVPATEVSPGSPLIDTLLVEVGQVSGVLPDTPVSPGSPGLDTITVNPGGLQGIVPSTSVNPGSPIIETIGISEGLLGAMVSVVTPVSPGTPTLDDINIEVGQVAAIVPSTSVSPGVPALEDISIDPGQTTGLVPPTAVSPGTPTLDTIPVDPGSVSGIVPSTPVDNPTVIFPAILPKGAQYLWRGIAGMPNNNTGTLNFWIRNRDSDWDDTNMSLITFSEGDTPRMEVGLTVTQLGEQTIYIESDDGGQPPFGGTTIWSWSVDPVAETDLNDGNWHMVTIIGFGGSYQLWVDNFIILGGAGDGEGRWFSDIQAGGDFDRISVAAFSRGGTPPASDIVDQFYRGSIDETLLLDQGLDAADIEKLWNLGNGLLHPQLESNWPFIWNMVMAAWEFNNDNQSFGKDYLGNYDLTPVQSEEGLMGEDTGIPGQ